MKVSIKDLAVNMELGNKGITLDIYDNQGNFLGDLRVGKATIEWCKGKTRSNNGKKVNLEQFIQWIEGSRK